MLLTFINQEYTCKWKRKPELYILILTVNKTVQSNENNNVIFLKLLKPK